MLCESISSSIVVFSCYFHPQKEQQRRIIAASAASLVSETRVLRMQMKSAVGLDDEGSMSAKLSPTEERRCRCRQRKHTLDSCTGYPLLLSVSRLASGERREGE